MTGRKAALGELFRIGSSKRVLQSQWASEGVPFYRGREITRLAADGYVNNDLFIPEDLYAEFAAKHGVPNADDIMITAIGTIGNSYIVRDTDRFYFKDASVLWLNKSADVNSEFINWWLKSPLFFDQLDRGNGATVNTLTIQKLQSVVVDLPPPEKQHRIVAILDEAFDGIATAKANAEKNLQNARALFESHLQSVFTERGEGWSDKQLKDFCAFENGDRGKNYPSKSARTATGVPFINAGHLTENGIDLETMDYISRERFDLLSNGKIRPGDILFCLRGSLGKFACVDNLSEGAIASSLVIVRPDETVLNDFLAAYFRSPICVAMIDSFRNGTAQPNLSAKSLGLFVAPIPPLTQQQSIVERLSNLRAETQRLESLYQQKLTALDDLKKSLLHQAFTGAL